MITVVVDTSVAVKWFVREDEGRDQALEILNQIKQQPTRFCVPELFFNEMLAVFCKLMRDANLIKEYIGILAELGMERIGNGGALLGNAAELAKQYDLSGYDAVFAASAKLLNGVWLTADKEAVKKLKGTGLAQMLGE